MQEERCLASFNCLFLPCPQISFHDAWLGFERSVAAGRLECTMQNLADCLVTPSEEPLEGSAAAQQLDSFVVYNQRRKVGWGSG